jgi:hypothetical protein
MNCANPTCYCRQCPHCGAPVLAGIALALLFMAVQGAAIAWPDGQVCNSVTPVKPPAESRESLIRTITPTGGLLGPEPRPSGLASKESREITIRTTARESRRLFHDFPCDFPATFHVMIPHTCTSKRESRESKWHTPHAHGRVETLYLLQAHTHTHARTTHARTGSHAHPRGTFPTLPNRLVTRQNHCQESPGRLQGLSIDFPETLPQGDTFRRNYAHFRQGKAPTTQHRDKDAQRAPSVARPRPESNCGILLHACARDARVSSDCARGTRS